VGLRDLRRQVALAVLAKRVADRLRKEQEMGRLKVGLFGLVGAAVTGVVAQVTAACPDIRGQLVAIGVAGLVGGMALWLSRPKEHAGLKATLTGLLTAVGAAVVTKVTAICPDLIAQLPTLVMAGVVAGAGLWLKSPKDAPPK